MVGWMWISNTAICPYGERTSLWSLFDPSHATSWTNTSQSTHKGFTSTKYIIRHAMTFKGQVLAGQKLRTPRRQNDKIMDSGSIWTRSGAGQVRIASHHAEQGPPSSRVRFFFIGAVHSGIVPSPNK